MIDLNSHLENFKKVFKEVKYLNKLMNQDELETLLFDTYEGILEVAGTSTRPFTDFSKEN